MSPKQDAAADQPPPADEPESPPPSGPRGPRGPRGQPGQHSHQAQAHLKHKQFGLDKMKTDLPAARYTPIQPLEPIEGEADQITHPCLANDGSCTLDPSHTRQGACLFQNLPRNWCLECLLGDSHAIHTGEPPEKHPCLRVFGKCKYGASCAFIEFPSCWCLYCCRGSTHLYCDGVTPRGNILRFIPENIKERVHDHEMEVRGEKKNMAADPTHRRTKGYKGPNPRNSRGPPNQYRNYYHNKFPNQQFPNPLGLDGAWEEGLHMAAYGLHPPHQPQAEYTHQSYNYNGTTFFVPSGQNPLHGAPHEAGHLGQAYHALHHAGAEILPGQPSGDPVGTQRLAELLATGGWGEWLALNPEHQAETRVSAQ